MGAGGKGHKARRCGADRGLLAGEKKAAAMTSPHPPHAHLVQRQNLVHQRGVLEATALVLTPEVGVPTSVRTQLVDIDGLPRVRGDEVGVGGGER